MLDVKDEVNRRAQVSEIFRNLLIETQIKEDEDTGIILRLAADVFLLGGPEYVRIRDRINTPKVAAKTAERVELIREDLINARNCEEAANREKDNSALQREYAYLSALEKIKDNELRPKFIRLVDARIGGADIEVPNCVMISGKNGSINSDILDWCKKNVNANVATIDAKSDDLIDALEQAEDDYQETGVWNLIHVKNMDNLIKKSSPSLASMKRIMCATSEDFHTTLIFTSDNPDDLDPIAIETNRVKRFNTDGIPDIKKMEKDDIKERLSTEGYATRSPLAAINDILDLAEADESKRVNFKSTKKELEEIRLNSYSLLSKLSRDERTKYGDMLDSTIKSLWYIV